ncbi:unnamed protein product [Calicophoron daubneyi]|uniref:Stress-associated endoplasmic reticulum protein n=1 Tax=Calicophoron daubneyi TaxID=300641 RepID=A0AAV2T4M0_CALDB
MSAVQRMKVQNERAAGNVKNRGNVPKSLKSQETPSNMNSWILGLIIFVVCGSGRIDSLIYYNLSSYFRNYPTYPDVLLIVLYCSKNPYSDLVLPGKM